MIECVLALGVICFTLFITHAIFIIFKFLRDGFNKKNNKV